MSMNSKQRWMGGVVLLGGGVLLAALLFKGSQELQHKEVPAVNQSAKAAAKTTEKAGEMQSLQPLTVDVETEKRLLEEQRRGRERAVAEQEARTQQYLAHQQQAEADAARKAAEEYAEVNKRRTKEQESSDNIPPDMGGEKSKLNPEVSAKTTAKSATSQNDADAKHKAEMVAKKKADDEAQHKADVAAKKKAEDDAQRKADLAAKKKADEAAQHKADLEAKKRAEEKRQAEEDRQEQLAELKAKKKAEAKKQQEKQDELDAKKAAEKKKAEAEKARKLLDGDERKNEHKKWMVQVALAGNQANADSIVSKLRAKGYKVTTSPTSKGIRIMVGPAKDRDTADIARKKIQADSSLGMKSAWVIDWVPLDQR